MVNRVVNQDNKTFNHFTDSYLFAFKRHIIIFTAYSGLVKKEVVDLKEGIPLKVQGADRAICLA